MGTAWYLVLLRIFIFLTVVFLLFLSQRYWFLRGWRFAGRFRRREWRLVLRGFCGAGLLLVAGSLLAGLTGLSRRVFPHGSMGTALLGLWLSSSLIAYLLVRLVAGVAWLWAASARLWGKLRQRPASAPAPLVQDLPDPSRRYFFQTASVLAAAVPFVGAVYGFASERLRFQSRHVDIPIPGLPPALDGLRIAQLSDIHASSYMPVRQIRRAVGMANELGADLAVVTGDFITGAYDPLEACIAELARLRAPLGVWGCNGNHEIYADAQKLAQELFRRHGMRLLREENAMLRWRGAAFNLIGVDYQRTRDRSGRRLPMLPGVEPLVRRDVPNILLSHNPNSFPRAAELGIELSLAGHTHGGQVRVEILDHSWSPARFMTPYIAGLFRRPLFAPAGEPKPADSVPASNLQPPASTLYVNRGLGTIGAPVRLGVPPEITLLTLRRTG